MSNYSDRWIRCTDREILIKGYYFPWGTKRIPYSAIRSVQRVSLSAGRGQLRIWGTANPRYWASLDPGRHSKSAGLILDLGHFVHPFITPDDPDSVENLIRDHGGPAASAGQERRGPVI